MGVFEPQYGILASRLIKGFLCLWLRLLAVSTSLGGRKAAKGGKPQRSFNLESSAYILKALILLDHSHPPRQATECETGASMGLLD